MIVVVASSAMPPTPELVAVLAGLVASSNEPFGIRCNASDKETSSTEHLMAMIAKSLGRSVLRFKPEGERASWRRDYYMVEHASLVVAFFTPGSEMTGGTGHVVKAALDRGIHVEAYTMDEHGDVVMIGSDAGNPNGVHIGSRPDVLRELAHV